MAPSVFQAYSREGKRSAPLKSKVPVDGGDYGVEIVDRDGGGGPVVVRIQVKLPKQFTFELPDLAQGDLAGD